MKLYFSDFFQVPRDAVEKYGAFDVSLVSDLPLFIDPFLLFNSKKQAYRDLHDGIIQYLRFLRDKSTAGPLDSGLLGAWYRFPEVRETWLGFTLSGNAGRGLGRTFADALSTNLKQIFRDFGAEILTKGSHLEKLCLIKEGVGKDNISDFATNLIHGYLLDYTQKFAVKHIDSSLRKRVVADHVRFNYETESWERAEYDLPWTNGHHVLLVPRDILTRDETWINKHDLIGDFSRIPAALPNAELRAQINNYFRMQLPKGYKRKDEDRAAFKTIQKYPELIDVFIRLKEDEGDRAVSISSEKVALSEQLYLAQFGAFVARLEAETPFYSVAGKTYAEALARANYMKDLIENKGCHKLFYVRGQPIRLESDLQILYRFVWFGSRSSVSREVNDGRGPADFLISRGASDKTVVELKLASNTQLKKNLLRQAEIYQKASDAQNVVKIIIFFSKEDELRARAILREVGLAGNPSIVLIDARVDNKPSGSKAQ